MEHWQDQGIVLSVRPHGENGGIVSLLTQEHGRYAGYVRGIRGAKMRGVLEVGNIVDVTWQARLVEDLGSYKLELTQGVAARFMQDPLKLAALQSACALCDEALPEREGHAGLCGGLRALFEALETDIWGAAYVMWEVAFLRELGFSLDFSKCAVGGDTHSLAYVSPKTGRSVSLKSGAPYKEKLLALPLFLTPSGGGGMDDDVWKGLVMCSYFLEHWAFAHHTQGIPELRRRFQLRFEAHFVKDSEPQLQK